MRVCICGLVIRHALIGVLNAAGVPPTATIPPPQMYDTPGYPFFAQSPGLGGLWLREFLGDFEAK